MKYALALLIMMQLSLALSGQDYSDKQNIQVVTTAEAKYPGGDQKLFTDIFYKIAYNDEARAAHLQDQVTIAFDVLPSGETDHVRIVKGVGYGLDEQILNFFGKASFTPQYQNGKAVKSSLVYNIPVAAY